MPRCVVIVNSRGGATRIAQVFAGGLPSGQVSIRIAIPQDQSLRGAPLFLQGIDATPLGALSLTDMRSLSIR